MTSSCYIYALWHHTNSLFLITGINCILITEYQSWASISRSVKKFYCNDYSASRLLIKGIQHFQDMYMCKIVYANLHVGKVIYFQIIMALSVTEQHQYLAQQIISSTEGIQGTDTQTQCRFFLTNYSDVLTGAMASPITGASSVYSTVCSGANQRKNQSSVSLAFVRGFHLWQVKTPHKGPVTHVMTSPCQTEYGWRMIMIARPIDHYHILFRNLYMADLLL